VKDDLFEQRFRHNMRRVGALTKLVYRGDEPDTFELDGASADICRAVVVFMHATFEDMLRTVARERIPQHATYSHLKDIPLASTTRPEKFHLGDLGKFRDKTVVEVVQQSVGEYLDRESFNSCRMVDDLLGQMGLNSEPFKSLYADLDAMMKRRHRIVHEVDLVSPGDTETVKWTIVDHVQLMLWNLAVLIFHAQLCVAIDPSNAFMAWTLERRQKAREKVREGIRILISLPREAEALLTGTGAASQRLSEAMGLLEPSEEEVKEFAAKLEAAGGSHSG